MPKREDEYSHSNSGERGQPLCPFCGSRNVYPVKGKKLRFFTCIVGWSCANENCRMYRKTFPNPSWGSYRRFK